MSNEHHFMPSENNEPEQDPFARLDLFEHDPRFSQVLSEIEALQANYVQVSHGDLKTVLLELNEKLGSIQWIGDKVEVTGKLRVAPWSQENSFKNDYFQQTGLVFGEDERGAYCHANNFALVMALVDVDEDEHNISEDGHFVLTFHTPDVFDNTQDDPDEFEELRSNAGDFIVYPDELEVMKFNTPSLEQIEKTLGLYYPAVYKEIIRTIGADTGRNGSRLLSDLKKFNLPLQRGGFDLDTFGQIGRYIYDRTDIDQESDYRFVINGPVEGMSTESGLVSNRSNGEQRMSGAIVALDFDLETSQLVFIVSELSSVGEGFELRVIPVKHVEKLQCVRPLQSRFGSIAMKNFDSPYDVQEFWNSQRAVKSQNNQSDVDELFSSINSIFKESEADYTYNEQGKFYELSIEEDITQLIDQYAHHLHTALNQYDEATNSTDIDALLMRDIEALKDVALGDIIATKQRTIFIESAETSEDGMVDFSINVLEGAQRLKGTFVALTITQFPSEATIHSAGEICELQPSLGMVLKDAVIFEDGAPETEYDTCEGEMIVMVALSVNTKFVKIMKGPEV